MFDLTGSPDQPDNFLYDKKELEDHQHSIYQQVIGFFRNRLLSPDATKAMNQKNLDTRDKYGLRSVVVKVGVDETNFNLTHEEIASISKDGKKVCDEWLSNYHDPNQLEIYLKFYSQFEAKCKEMSVAESKNYADKLNRGEISIHLTDQPHNQVKADEVIQFIKTSFQHMLAKHITDQALLDLKQAVNQDTTLVKAGENRYRIDANNLIKSLVTFYEATNPFCDELKQLMKLQASQVFYKTGHVLAILAIDPSLNQPSLADNMVSQLTKFVERSESVMSESRGNTRSRAIDHISNMQKVINLVNPVNPAMKTALVSTTESKQPEVSAPVIEPSPSKRR